MEQPAPASPTAAAAVPVTFVIMPEGVTMDNTFDPMCTVDDLKHAVETEMPAAAAIVKFTLAGKNSGCRMLVSGVHARFVWDCGATSSWTQCLPIPGAPTSAQI
jgi:hypothetical protein